jgi:threonine/homoserine/homoserine lactone efflux protein
MISLVIKVMTISASGALAPGPLTAAIAAAGLKKGWKAGIQASLGHTAVEFPLVLILSAGVAAIFKNRAAMISIGFMGALFLLLFGFITIRDAIRIKIDLPGSGTANADTGKYAPSSFVTGAALSALNPYFIAWWVGIGTPLISEAMARAGLPGVGAIYVAHVWMDYAWLTFIASIASLGRGKAVLLRIMPFILGLLVIYFGVMMFKNTMQLFMQHL